IPHQLQVLGVVFAQKLDHLRCEFPWLPPVHHQTPDNVVLTDKGHGQQCPVPHPQENIAHTAVISIRHWATCGQQGLSFLGLGGLWTAGHLPPLASYRSGGDRLRRTRQSGQGDGLPELVTTGGLCAGRVNPSKIRGALLPSPQPPSQAPEIESLSTRHPQKNDKFRDRCCWLLPARVGVRRAELVPSEPFDEAVAVVIQRQR